MEPPDADQRELWRATTPSSRAVHHAKARRVRLNGLPPCMPVWLRPAANLTRTSPGSRMGDACRSRSVTKVLTNLPMARSPLDSCRVLRTVTQGPHAGACTASCCFHPWEIKRFWSCHLHGTWWLLVRAEDQAGREHLALARATRLADHEASGAAAHTFDASWSKEFNAVAGDDKFWAAQARYCMGLSGPWCEASAQSRFAHADDNGHPKPNCVREFAPASSTARDSTHPQQLKDGTCCTDYNGCKICRERSRSSDKCVRVSCRTFGIRCLQKLKADRAAKDKISWK